LFSHNIIFLISFINPQYDKKWFRVANLCASTTLEIIFNLFVESLKRKDNFDFRSRVKNLAKDLNIKILLFPPYSPNFKPIERLWKFFKKKVLYNEYYEKFKYFKNASAIFFRGIRKYKAELKTFITDKFSAVGT
jgi:hypothetical protein